MKFRELECHYLFFSMFITDLLIFVNIQSLTDFWNAFSNYCIFFFSHSSKIWYHSSRFIVSELFRFLIQNGLTIACIIFYMLINIPKIRFLRVWFYWFRFSIVARAIKVLPLKKIRVVYYWCTYYLFHIRLQKQSYFFAIKITLSLLK